jgi:preprotein translocase subunit YajC
LEGDVNELILSAPAFFQNSSPGSSFMALWPFLAIFAIMYFLILRPQQKKQKKHQQMISELKKGDKVITAGGIHGSIVGTKEKTFIVKIDENVKIEVTRSSVASKAE